MKKSVVLLILVGISVLTSCIQTEFTLESPPKDWYRFVDPVSNIAVWLPGSWEAEIWDVTSSDINVPTYYHPTVEDTDTEVWIGVITPVDFREDYLDPSRGEYGDPPVDIYDIKVNNVLVPCARYDLGSYRWKHICIIGAYPIQQFYPESNGRQIYIELSLITKENWEAQVVPVWQMMVASFVLEQPPQELEP